MDKKKGLIIGVIILLLAVVCVVLYLLLGNKTYTVTFDTGGGSTVASMTVKKGEKITEPVAPTFDGYTFVYWSYNGKQYDFNTPITSDMRLRAAWSVAQPIKTGYTITFDTDGGSTIDNQMVTDNGTINKPADPTKEGYIFVGWQVNGVDYNFDTAISQDTVVKAVWEADPDYVPNTDHTVTFDTDGGNTIESKTVKDGEKVAKPTNPKKNGYKFVEWQLNGTKYDFTATVTEDITLVAIWEMTDGTTATSYIVTFDSDGGSDVRTQTVSANGRASKPTAPTKEGYTFIEWQLNGKSYNFNSKVTNDLTLKAYWVSNDDIFTVTFNSNGGSNVSSQKVIRNKTATKPTNPTKKGYTFVEWQLNDKAYNFSTKVTNNLELVAKWKENVTTYTVTFDSDGGSSVASQKVNAGGKATQPSNPTKSGYTFNGWLLNGSSFEFSIAINSNITLKASWKTNNSTPDVPVVPTTYTVTFNSNGGSSVASQTVNAGGKATKPTNPTKSGNTFNGWLLNGSPFEFSTPINSNITLTASWTPESHSYRVVATRVDDQTPARILKTYDGNTEITVNGYVINGVSISSQINYNVIKNLTKINVVLSNGRTIEAPLTVN